MPNLVREMGVSGDDVDFSASLLEFSVVFSCIFNFGRAVEGESCRHENQDRPLALEVLVGNFNELALAGAIDERLRLEGLNLRIDQGRHVVLLG